MEVLTRYLSFLDKDHALEKKIKTILYEIWKLTNVTYQVDQGLGPKSAVCDPLGGRLGWLVRADVVGAASQPGELGPKRGALPQPTSSLLPVQSPPQTSQAQQGSGCFGSAHLERIHSCNTPTIANAIDSAALHNCIPPFSLPRLANRLRQSGNPRAAREDAAISPTCRGRVLHPAVWPPFESRVLTRYATGFKKNVNRATTQVMMKTGSSRRPSWTTPTGVADADCDRSCREDKRPGLRSGGEV